MSKKMFFNQNKGIPYSKLISYYKHNGNSNDYNGVNNGTDTNVIYATDGVGDCAVFNGTSSYVRIPDNNSLSFTDGVNDKKFSISTFVKFNAFSTSSQYYMISKRDNSSTLQEWYFSFVLGKLRIILFNGSNYIYAEIYSPPTTGIWYHYVATYDGSKSQNGFELFINKVKQTGLNRVLNGAYVGAVNTNSLVTIGRANNDLVHYVDGKMDETSIWNDKLTSNNVKEIFDKFQSGNPLIV